MRISKIAGSIFVCVVMALAQRPIVAAQAIPAVAEKMKEAIAQNEIAGAVTLVANKDTILHFDATGLADVSNQTPMSRDALFWIASMSKPVTGAAVMMMQEQGKL